MASPDRTHYEVLGLARDADADAVRRAWKVHVQVWHPDRFEGDMRDEAQQQAARINEAYTTLRDAGRRAAYDCRLAADELSARPEPAPSRARSARAFPQPSAHAHDATPLGHVATAPAPQQLGDQLREVARDVGAATRRHPRMTAAVAATLVLAVVGTAVMNAVTGPSLPAGATASAATKTPVSRVAHDDAPEIGKLAAEMRAEAELAQQQLEELVAQGEAEPQVVPDDLEPVQPKQAPRGAAAQPRLQEITRPDGTKALRVLPAE